MKDPKTENQLYYNNCGIYIIVDKIDKGMNGNYGTCSLVQVVTFLTQPTQNKPMTKSGRKTRYMSKSTESTIKLLIFEKLKP